MSSERSVKDLFGPYTADMAERVGFEPTVRFPVRSLSRRVLSTAQSPLRGRYSLIVAKPFPMSPLLQDRQFLSAFRPFIAAPRRTLAAPQSILPQTIRPSHSPDDSSSGSSTAQTKNEMHPPSDHPPHTQAGARVPERSRQHTSRKVPTSHTIPFPPTGN